MSTAPVYVSSDSETELPEVPPAFKLRAVAPTPSSTTAAVMQKPIAVPAPSQPQPPVVNAAVEPHSNNMMTEALATAARQNSPVLALLYGQYVIVMPDGRWTLVPPGVAPDMAVYMYITQPQLHAAALHQQALQMTQPQVPVQGPIRAPEPTPEPVRKKAQASTPPATPATNAPNGPVFPAYKTLASFLGGRNEVRLKGKGMQAIDAGGVVFETKGCKSILQAFERFGQWAKRDSRYSQELEFD